LSMHFEDKEFKNLQGKKEHGRIEEEKKEMEEYIKK
jgi:hypothetical protein